MRTYSLFTSSLPYSVEVIEEPLRPTGPNEDGSLVLFHESRLRVVAMDGVSPSPETPSRLGNNGAIAGVAVLRTAFLAMDDLETCVRRANDDLYRADIAPHRNSQACYAAADIDPLTGRVTVLRGCDCDLFVRRPDGRWEAVFAPAAKVWAMAMWKVWLDAHQGVSEAVRQQSEGMVWDSPDAWTSHPAGRHADPVMESATIESEAWTELVLTSDGAHLDIERLSDLDGFLGTLCGDHHEGPGYLSHGDITIVRVRRTA